MIQDEIQVITRSTEDGVTDEIFFENFSESTSSTVPSALTRWAEEGQILDAQGVHYCVATVKPEIIPVLLKHQAEEIAKGREEEQKKKAEAQAKAAASKKEEEERKKQESGKAGGETGTTAEGEGTSTAASDAPPSVEPQSEVMQVEEQPAAAESEPAAAEQDDTGNTSASIGMSMDEPILSTSIPSADQASIVRTSTPADDSEDPTAAPAPTLTPPAHATSVAQDIISAATVEAAANQGGSDEVSTPQPTADAPQATQSEAASTEHESRQQEGDGSPMALGEEGTSAAVGAEATQDSLPAGDTGT